MCVLVESVQILYILSSLLAFLKLFYYQFTVLFTLIVLFSLAFFLSIVSLAVFFTFSLNVLHIFFTFYSFFSCSMLYLSLQFTFFFFLSSHFALTGLNIHTCAPLIARTPFKVFFHFFSNIWPFLCLVIPSGASHVRLCINVLSKSVCQLSMTNLQKSTAFSRCRCFLRHIP